MSLVVSEYNVWNGRALQKMCGILPELKKGKRQPLFGAVIQSSNFMRMFSTVTCVLARTAWLQNSNSKKPQQVQEISAMKSSWILRDIFDNHPSVSMDFPNLQNCIWKSCSCILLTRRIVKRGKSITLIYHGKTDHTTISKFLYWYYLTRQFES
jgi:hypothetical protein